MLVPLRIVSWDAGCASLLVTLEDKWLWIWRGAPLAEVRGRAGQVLWVCLVLLGGKSKVQHVQEKVGKSWREDRASEDLI